MAQDPAFVCIYGASGFGKTVDVGYAFPNAVYYAKRGGTKSIVSVCGYQPALIAHSTIDAVVKDIPQIAKHGKYDAIVVDEFDFLAEDTLSMLEKKFTGFKLFGELRKAVTTFRNTARDCGLHVVVTCLEKPPKTKEDGTKQRGGPALTGDLPEKLPAMCDLVLRTGKDPLRRPWPGVYRLDQNNSEWVTKDRDNNTPDTAPMNLGEILRAGGYVLSRHPSVPWQEEFVETLAAKLVAATPAEDTATITEFYGKLLESKVAPNFAVWTVRDAWDRALLRRYKQARAQKFI